MTHGTNKGNTRAQWYRKKYRRDHFPSYQVRVTEPLPAPPGMKLLGPRSGYEYWRNATHHGYVNRMSIPTPFDLKPRLKDIPKPDVAWLNKVKKLGVKPLTE